MATKGREEGEGENGTFLSFNCNVIITLRHLCLSLLKAPETKVTMAHRVTSVSGWVPGHCEQGSQVCERASQGSHSAVLVHQPRGRRSKFQPIEGNSGKKGRHILELFF